MRDFRKLIVLAAIVGLLPYPLARVAPSSVYLALLLPMFLSSATFQLTRGLPVRQQITQCVIACLTSTTVFSLVILSVGLSIGQIRFAFAVIPAPL